MDLVSKEVCMNMAMKSKKQYGGVAHVSAGSQYPAINQTYWAPQSQTVPYSLPGMLPPFLLWEISG